MMDVDVCGRLGGWFCCVKCAWFCFGWMGWVMNYGVLF